MSTAIKIIHKLILCS